MGKERRQSPSTLLWFIRHKSYVPISEIRRRFLIESDDGTFIEAGNHRRAYVGLPNGTAQSLEKLWQQGKIGFEFSSEFDANVLIGVYPMVPSKEHLNGGMNGHGYGHARIPQQEPTSHITAENGDWAMAQKDENDGPGS
ncbi:MAG TPA: hypothetical protein VF221_17725 [Chloroflexota bacterium]